MNRIVFLFFFFPFSAHARKSLYPGYYWIISQGWFEKAPQSVCQPGCNDDFNHSDWWEDQWSTTLTGTVTKLEPDHKQCVRGQRFHLNTHPRKRWSVAQSHQAICRNGYGGGITSVMFLSCCYCRLFHSLVEGVKWSHRVTAFLFFFFTLLLMTKKLFSTKIQYISIFHMRLWAYQ